MTTTKIQAEKVVLVRALHDFAPKIVAAALGGLTATTLIALAHLAHVTLDPAAAAALAALAAILAGYLKADSPVTATERKALATAKADVDTAAPVVNLIAPRVAPYVEPVKSAVDAGIDNILGPGGADASATPTVTQG